MASGITYSSITYTDSKGDTVSLALPTIQSISIPDSTTIPSRPTITGEYRNQYVVQNAIKVNFTMWLENSLYGSVWITISEIMDALGYLKDSRTRFNMTVTSNNEEQRFLSDLVIENVSYSRDSDHHGRLVCIINATHIKLVDLEWILASAVDIFGHSIFTDDSESKILNMDFVSDSQDGAFSLTLGSLGKTVDWLSDISGYKDLPVSYHIRNQIQDTVALSKDCMYFKLSSPIDLSAGSRKYNCGLSFYSDYGVDSENRYTVDFGTFTLDLKKGDSSLEADFPLSKYVPSFFAKSISLGSDSTAALNPMSLLAWKASEYASKTKSNTSGAEEATAPHIYNFANTYDNFVVSNSFEYIADSDALSEYLQDDKTTFSEEEETKNTNVIEKNGYVYTNKISKQYEYTVGYGSFSKKIKPDGGLKIDIHTITTAEGLNIEVSDSSMASAWTGDFTLYVVTITLGTMLQIYLFCNKLFNINKVITSA